MKKLGKKSKKDLKQIFIGLSFVLVVAIIAIISGIGTNRSIPLNFDGDRLNGIDVSSHNGEIDWAKVKGNIDFAFIRVGYRGYQQGNINKDKQSERNLRQANKNKIPVGVYFYSQAITKEEAVEEAKFVLDIVKWHDISLPIVIDFEYPVDDNGNKIGRLYDSNLSVDDKTGIINAFNTTIKESGYKYGVYASSNVLNYHLNANDFIDDTIIWVAQYSDKLKYTKHVDIWQYSKTGHIDGVYSKYVDLNYWFNNKNNS